MVVTTLPVVQFRSKTFTHWDANRGRGRDAMRLSTVTVCVCCSYIMQEHSWRDFSGICIFFPLLLFLVLFVCITDKNQSRPHSYMCCCLMPERLRHELKRACLANEEESLLYHQGCFNVEKEKASDCVSEVYVTAGCERISCLICLKDWFSGLLWFYINDAAFKKHLMSKKGRQSSGGWS